MFSDGTIIHDTISEIKNISNQVLHERDIQPCFDLRSFDLLKFKLLDCQNKILLFLKSSQERSDFDFDKFALVDLDLEVCNKALGQAHGNGAFCNVTANYDGSQIYSVVQNKGDWVIHLYSIKILENKMKRKSYKGEKSVLSLAEKKLIGGLPIAMCLLYERNLLVVSAPTGALLVYRTDLDLSSKKYKKVVSLKSTFSENFFAIKKGETDAFDQMVASWDQKFLIAKSQLSQVHILRVRKDSIEQIHYIQCEDYISTIALSPNGRFVMTSGAFFESVSRIDLAELDKTSFEIETYDCVWRLGEYADSEAKKQGEKQEQIFDKVLFYRYGSLREYSQKMENRIRRLQASHAALTQQKDKFQLQKQKLEMTSNMIYDSEKDYSSEDYSNSDDEELEK